jgi:amino acid adenylation domain-containing protein
VHDAVADLTLGRGPRVPYPERCLHELIADHAARIPDAVALEMGPDVLTYGELEARANQLAHRLQERGVGPEVLVGLAVERSFDLVLGILGILKAGGAYLPLDPEYPADRLAYMVGDAGIGLLLTTGDAQGAVPTDGLDVILLDRPEDLAGAPTTAPPSTVRPEDLMYVMYTSGSTGRPKGVLVTHRGLTSLCVAGTPSLAPSWGHKVLQFHSPSFDPSMWEIILSLGHGGTLVLADRDALMPGRSLVRVLADHGVNTLVMPASALAALPFEPLPDLEDLFLEGEAPVPALVRRWGEGRRVWNTYGPTEASCWCIGTQLDGTENPAPIGRPIANVDVHILDGAGRPVPVGDVGELHVGSPGLARGYLGRDDLTAQRFVPDPFGDEPGGRLYRTGDLARFRPDGVIDFLGRVDDQVKVRGHRVELGEIENVLLQHAGVREAACAAREDRPGYRRLVAYVVPVGDPLSATELRAHLRERMPEHLVPSAYMNLERLPRSPTGKLDRRALPDPGDDRPEIDQEMVAAVSEVEVALTEIWQEALGLGEIGVRDDFYELGGDSLLAIMVLSDLEALYGVPLSGGELNDVPATIEAIAAFIDEARARPAAEAAP